MTRTQYYCAATVDGFIADPNGGLDWLFVFEGGADEAKRFTEGVGALVMGSATYEWMLEHLSKWPYEGLPTWVFTHRELASFEGADVRFVQGSPKEHIEEMRTAAGERNLWLVGGGELASQFVDEGLLEELILTLAPVVLGEGIPLFARGMPGQLRLTGTREFESGMVELRYELSAGSVGRQP